MAESPQPSGGAPRRREPPKLVRRLQERRETHRERGRIYRTAWAVAGFTVFAMGVAMLVLPGPALLVIPIGLAILSLEFAWAERLLDHALERGVGVRDLAKQASRRQKILGGMAALLAVAAAATLTWVLFL